MGAALAEQATQAFKLITFVVIVVVVSLIIVECVTRYVKCVTASSDTAMYAGMSCELNHVLEGCYEKFGTCALE